MICPAALGPLRRALDAPDGSPSGGVHRGTLQLVAPLGIELRISAAATESEDQFVEVAVKVLSSQPVVDAEAQVLALEKAR
jgi:hypothetical protein